MIGNTSLDTALLGYVFELLITCTVARDFENVVIPAHTFIFLNDAFWNIEQSDIGFCVGLLSSGDNTQVAIEECLQVVIGDKTYSNAQWCARAQTMEPGIDEIGYSMFANEYYERGEMVLTDEIRENQQKGKKQSGKNI